MGLSQLEYANNLEWMLCCQVICGPSGASVRATMAMAAVPKAVALGVNSIIGKPKMGRKVQNVRGLDAFCDKSRLSPAAASSVSASAEGWALSTLAPPAQPAALRRCAAASRRCPCQPGMDTGDKKGEGDVRCDLRFSSRKSPLRWARSTHDSPQQGCNAQYIVFPAVLVSLSATQAPQPADCWCLATQYTQDMQATSKLQAQGLRLQ